MLSDGIFCVGMGREHCTDLHSWGPGMRETTLIHYVIRGRGFYEADGKKYTVEAGQSFIIYPYVSIYYYPDPEDPWEYTWVDMRGTMISELTRNTCFSRSNPVCKHMSRDVMLPLFGLPSVFATTPAEKYRSAGGILILLSAYSDVSQAVSYKNGTDSFVRAKNYIAVNYYDPSLSIDSLSAAVGIHRTYLYRIFKSKTGISPVEYLSRFRIDRACEMFSTTAENVKNVAYSVGYRDQLYFSKIFKAQTGLSPSVYKRRLNEK